jgi:hypothetical protein
MSLRKLKKAYKKAEAGKKLTGKELIMIRRGDLQTEKAGKSSDVTKAGKKNIDKK